TAPYARAASGRAPALSRSRRATYADPTGTPRHSRRGAADGVRAPGVVHPAAADERHGSGLQAPAVGCTQVGVAVVADPHVVGGAVDEAQRLGAARRVALEA